MTNDTTPAPLALFDGVCTLCNGAVDFVLRNDRRRVVRFASLQSEAGRAALQAAGGDVDALDTIALIDGDGLHVRSAAVLRLAGYMGWPWRAAMIGLLIPGFVRDPMYRYVAARRYRWFGKREACRLPGPGEAERILG